MSSNFCARQGDDFPLKMHMLVHSRIESVRALCYGEPAARMARGWVNRRHHNNPCAWEQVDRPSKPSRVNA